MTDHDCALDCGRPVPDTSYACPQCGDRLADLLRAVPGILDDLDDVIARQVRFTTGGGRFATDERPLPFNPAGSDSRHVLVSTLLVWAQLVSEQRGIVPTSWDPADLGPWLAGHVGWMRAQAAGPEAMAELDAAVRQARRVTDRPVDRQYAGPCTQEIELDGVQRECGTDLYARPDRDAIKCPTCGTEVPVAERRAWLLDQAEDILLPANELARAIDGLGIPVTANTVKSWVRRKQLVAYGATPAGAATYRVGDVLALVREAARRRGVASA